MRIESLLERFPFHGKLSSYIANIRYEKTERFLRRYWCAINILINTYMGIRVCSYYESDSFTMSRGSDWPHGHYSFYGCDRELLMVYQARQYHHTSRNCLPLLKHQAISFPGAHAQRVANSNVATCLFS